MSEDRSSARAACTVGASRLKERVSALLYAQSEPPMLEAIVAAVREALPASLATGDHHHTLLGVLLFGDDRFSFGGGGGSVYVAAAAMDIVALRRGGVAPGNDRVWCTGEPPGQRRHFDAASRTLVYAGAKTTPRPGSPRAARGASSAAAASASASASSPFVAIARRKPWVADCLRRGSCWTSPYPDPLTGQLVESFVLPLESPRDATAVVGVIVAGSLLAGGGGESLSRARSPAPVLSSSSSPPPLPPPPAAATSAASAASAAASAATETRRTHGAPQRSPPCSALLSPPGPEELSGSLGGSRGLSKSKYASFFAATPPPPPMGNSTNTWQIVTPVAPAPAVHAPAVAVPTVDPSGNPARAPAVGAGDEAAAAPVGETPGAGCLAGGAGGLRGRQAPPAISVPAKVPLAGKSTAAASVATLPWTGAVRPGRSRSPRGHGYRSPPSLSPPLPVSPTSAGGGAAARSRGGSCRGSGSCSSSSSGGGGASGGGGGPGRASPVPFWATPPTSSWLEIDLAREMDLEHLHTHALPQSSSTSPAESTTRLESHRAVSPAEGQSSSGGASPHEDGALHYCEASAAVGLSPSAAAIEQPAPPPPQPPLPLVPRSVVARLPPPMESVLVRSLAAKSASLLAKARTERLRIHKLRVLINESSPERLDAVLANTTDNAAKARGAAAAAADARDASQAALHAAARGAGQAGGMAMLDLQPSERLAALVAAELDALLALSPDDLTTKAGLSGGASAETASLRRPPSRHTSRRFPRGPLSSPAGGAPAENGSSGSSSSSSALGSGLVSGLLRRIGLGSPAAPVEGCAAPADKLPSGGVPSARWVTSPVALRPVERWRSAGSISDDDDFHSADEGDEG